MRVLRLCPLSILTFTVLVGPIVAGSLSAHVQFTREQTQVTPLPAPQWEIEAGGAARFETASVRPNSATAAWHSNVGLTDDSGDSTTGNVFSASDVPLDIYIEFAYKVPQRQMQFMRSKLPKWALTARFDIEAMAGAQNTTKDRMRLMMQALLVREFNLAAHRESREVGSGGPMDVLIVDRIEPLTPN